jgi:hypothetical protein
MDAKHGAAVTPRPVEKKVRGPHFDGLSSVLASFGTGDPGSFLQIHIATDRKNLSGTEDCPGVSGASYLENCQSTIPSVDQLPA